MAPVKKIVAGSVSSVLWNNEATVNGKKINMLKTIVERRNGVGAERPHW